MKNLFKTKTEKVNIFAISVIVAVFIIIGVFVWNNLPAKIGFENDKLIFDDAYIEHENITHDPILLTGQGAVLDDLSSSGIYTGDGNTVFYIEIDGTAPDTFKWRKGSAGTWTTDIAFTGIGTPVLLQDGVSIDAATTGHTLGVKWEMNVGHELHFNESIHFLKDVTIGGGTTFEGEISSHSPVKFRAGEDGGISTDIINERTSDAGVIIDGVQIKDASISTDEATLSFSDETTGTKTLAELTSGGSGLWERIETKLTPQTAGDDILLNTGEMEIFTRSSDERIAEYKEGSVTNFFFDALFSESANNNALVWGADNVSGDKVFLEYYMDGRIRQIAGDFGLKNGIAINEFSSDGTMADNSDIAIPTEKAVKTYVNDAIGVALGTHIVEGPADTDIIAKDPGDPTKIITIAPFKLRTVTTTNGIASIKSIVSIPAGVEVTNTIPAFTGGWLGVKETSGTYEFFSKDKRDDFDLATECPIGRADRTATDISAIVSLPELGFGYAQDLYNLMAVTGLSKHISGGDLQTIAGSLTLKRLEGRWWRTFANRDENQRHKMTNTVHDPVTAYEIHSAYGDVEIPTEMEVGFIDDGAGGKTAIGADEWSFYLCYHWARHTGVGFEGYQRSTRSFISLHEARALRGQGIPEMHSALDAAVLTHIIYIKGNATDLGDPEQCSIEWVRKDNIASSGDPLVGELQQSGVIDWVGTEILTINADPTKFDRGEIRIGSVDRETGVKFVRTIPSATFQTVTNLTSDPFTFYGYNIATESFIQQSTPMNRITLNNIIPIGLIWHRNKTIIDLTQTMPLVVETSHDYAGQLLAFGALKQSGINLSANGANKKVNLSAGVLEVLGGTSTVRENISNAQPTPEIPLSFTPVHRAVTTGKVVFETVTDDPDYDVYDDGSGTLVALSPNNFGIHYFYIFAFRTTTDVFMVRGDESYATLEDAQIGLQRNTIPIPSDFKSGFPFAAVIAKKGTTNLQTAITMEDAVITSADRFGSFGAGGGGGGGMSGFVQEIAGTTDFNTMLTTGHFRSDHSGAPVNGGDVIWGWYLKVEVNTTVMGRIYQRHLSQGGSVLHEYVRRSHNNGTSWTTWVEIANTEPGTVTGQMAYWDNTAYQWKPIATNEMFWDGTLTTISDDLNPSFNILGNGEVFTIQQAQGVNGFFMSWYDPNSIRKGYSGYGQSSNQDIYWIVNESTNGDIRIITDGTGVVDIQADLHVNGNMGIDTASPSGKLGIKAGSNDGVNMLAFDEGDNDPNFWFEANFAGTGATGNWLTMKDWNGNNCMTWRGDGNVDNGGYTKLGSDAPAIKVKKFTSTTAASEGGYVYILHGLTASKILSVDIRIEDVSNFISAEYTGTAEYQASVLWNLTDISVKNHSTNSGSILSKPLVILVTYEE